jgi:hypothetical protein
MEYLDFLGRAIVPSGLVSAGIQPLGPLGRSLRRLHPDCGPLSRDRDAVGNACHPDQILVLD